MRGAHPRDAELFAPAALTALQQAASDLRYLLGRGYAQRSALKLVGDRFELRARPRQLLFRAVCAPSVAAETRATALEAAAVRGRPLAVDVYNVLITAETARAGGMIIECDDGAWRDLAEAHGAYRHNEHSDPVLSLMATTLTDIGATPLALFVDSPMAFSGLLAQRLRALLPGANVAIVASADRAIMSWLNEHADGVVASSDSLLLRRGAAHVDLAARIIRWAFDAAWRITL